MMFTQELEKKLRQLEVQIGKKQILYSPTSLSGAVGCCHILGVDYSNGDLYYKDDTGNWALAAAGGGGGGGGTVSSLSFLNTLGITGTITNPTTVPELSLSLTKSAVGLANVDNTADTAKPVSTAQQTALNLKANLASPTFTGTVAGITKTMVGLANVDNTTDLNKPISTLTQTALNAKENTITAGTTAQYYRGDKSFQTLNKAAVGLSNVDNTSDLSKPISTATQTALNDKAPLVGGLVPLVNLPAVYFENTDFTGDGLTLGTAYTIDRTINLNYTGVHSITKAANTDFLNLVNSANSDTVKLYLPTPIGGGVDLAISATSGRINLTDCYAVRLPSVIETPSGLGMNMAGNGFNIDAAGDIQLRTNVANINILHGGYNKRTELNSYTGFALLLNAGTTDNGNGSVIIGSDIDVPCAKLKIDSTTQGVLLPRMTKTQRDAISTPLAGLAVFQTDNTPGLRVYDGVNWKKFTETND